MSEVPYIYDRGWVDIHPRLWLAGFIDLLESIAYTYPVNPSVQEKDSLKQFLKSTLQVLPSQKIRHLLRNFTNDRLLDWKTQGRTELIGYVYGIKKMVLESGYVATYPTFQVYGSPVTFDLDQGHITDFYTNLASGEGRLALSPMVWKSVWGLFHSISYAYPTLPNFSDKQNIYNFYTGLAEWLACIHCRDFLANYENVHDIRYAYGSRGFLRVWGYKAHDDVNLKLRKQMTPKDRGRFPVKFKSPTIDAVDATYRYASDLK